MFTTFTTFTSRHTATAYASPAEGRTSIRSIARTRFARGSAVLQLELGAGSSKKRFEHWNATH